MEELERWRGRASRLKSADAGRKQVEEELRLANSYNRSLIEASLDPLVTIDPDGKISDVNVAMQEITGYSRESLIGTDFSNYFTKPEKVREGYQKAFKEGSVRDYELEIRHLDGHATPVLYNASVYRDDTGEVIGVFAAARDITGHRRAEEELRKSEKRYHAILENVNDLIFMLNTAGDIVYMNPAIKRVSGYTQADVVGRNFTEFIHPEDLPGLTDYYLKTLKREASFAPYEYRIISKDGAIKYMRGFGRPLKEEGENIGLVGVMTDITDRKWAENALQESEERLRIITGNVHDVIWTADINLNITYISPSVKHQMGYTVEEAMALTLVEVMTPASFELALKRFRKELEIESTTVSDPPIPVTFVAELCRKDGTTFWSEISVGFLRDADDTPYGVLGISRDVTDRKRAEERLGRLNRLFLGLGADLIENIEMIIHTAKDILGGTLAGYSRLEKGRLSMLSTEPGEEGFTVTDRPEDCVCYEAISAGGKEPLLIEDLHKTRYLDTDSRIKRLGLRSYLGYPVELKGQAIGFLYLFDSERRDFSPEDIDILGAMARAISIEEERLAREEGLKDFIDIASHELRHPITIIKGYAHTLKQYEDDIDEDMRREILDDIDTGADRLDKLVGELLDVSRIERGRFPISRREVSIEELIDRAVTEMREKGIQNEIRVSISEAGESISSDPDKVNAVLVILLDNAAKFSPLGSGIEIEAGIEGEEAAISVLDRGQGIPGEDRERVFERFYQVGDVLHHSSPGMGMGLYIAKEAVEAHGGKIWCEAREGGGSIFRFTIPKYPAS